eukprot:TRINITY_DN15967_c0_g1_i1.p1 TRINITY_DN15967_c0_g1~~TRINITY_DN15967_c0_g1_i1.p1  ORF type:complete len:325 (-),score=117.56 TRINITY_DN15967_c0_g1_i1:262-1236(-)
MDQRRRAGVRRVLRPVVLAAGAVGLTALASGVWDLRRHGAAAKRSDATAAVGLVGAETAPAETLGEWANLRVELTDKVQSKLRGWEKTATEGRTIWGFGKQATQMVDRTLSSYDSRAEGHGEEAACAAERQNMETELQHQLHSIFLVQRSSIEESLYQRLKRDLLKRMRRKKAELDVKEKLTMLQKAMKEYDSQVKNLQPAFVENSERDRAEQRLSTLQWGIMDTSEGQEMQARWKMDKMRRMPMHQSRGISVSLSPGMNLMFRPPGFGNFQLQSKREVGPPHNANEVSIGLLNDGKVVDVYNDKASPPKLKFQPTVSIDLSIG